LEIFKLLSCQFFVRLGLMQDVNEVAFKFFYHCLPVLVVTKWYLSRWCNESPDRRWFEHVEQVILLCDMNVTNETSGRVRYKRIKSAGFTPIGSSGCGSFIKLFYLSHTMVFESDRCSHFVQVTSATINIFVDTHCHHLVTLCNFETALWIIRSVVARQVFLYHLLPYWTNFMSGAAVDSWLLDDVLFFIWLFDLQTVFTKLQCPRQSIDLHCHFFGVNELRVEVFPYVAWVACVFERFMFDWAPQCLSHVFDIVCAYILLLCNVCTYVLECKYATIVAFTSSVCQQLITSYFIIVDLHTFEHNLHPFVLEVDMRCIGYFEFVSHFTKGVCLPLICCTDHVALRH